MKSPLTVVILTLNEENFIERCIERIVEWADEVLVVDSGSTDRTRDLAAAMGARVIEQPWLGWVGQHNAGIDAARNDWCMKLDADEIVDDQLAESITVALAANPDPRTGFVVTRVEEFASRLLPNTRRTEKRSTFVRLMHRGYSRYDPTMLIHEEVRITGDFVPLAGSLLHWRGFSLDQRFAQDNRNATLEARMLAEKGTRPTVLRLISMPLLRFLWCYVRCGLWRTGKHGLVYSLSTAMREIMRYSKLWELTEVEHLRDPPQVNYTRSPARSPANSPQKALREASR